MATTKKSSTGVGKISTLKSSKINKTWKKVKVKGMYLYYDKKGHLMAMQMMKGWKLTKSTATKKNTTTKTKKNKPKKNSKKVTPKKLKVSKSIFDSSKNPKCSLYNYDSKETLICQFNPEEVLRSRSVSYSTVTSPGMAYPLIQFVNGEVQDFDATLLFYDRGAKYTGFINTAMDFINTLIPPTSNKKKWYNKQSKQKNLPPTVKFVYGTWSVKCVVTGYKIVEEMRNENGKVDYMKITLSLRRL